MHSACSRTLRGTGTDTDAELVKHIKENYIHRVHQAVQVSNALSHSHIINVIYLTVFTHIIVFCVQNSFSIQKLSWYIFCTV